MVLQNDGCFSELQNTTSLFGQGKCFKNSGEENEVRQTVDGREEKTVETLQSAFLKFKRNRQNKLQLQSAVMGKKRLKQYVRSEEQVNKLREKFVELAKSYLGIPYARRYHEPGSPEYDAPLFLDCCGLVRKVLRDMKEDLGFSIGPWNQAYMFDTLPNTIEDVKDLKPGDLVFVSGIFYDPKKRKQRHNIVHVEIWAGDGEKTIGARWQKGKVQVHDSYQYVSKSYYNMVYHFKSIDTWLNGTCQSFCSQHPWRSSVSIPGKRSIFSMVQADEPADAFGDEKYIREVENFDKGKSKFFEEEESDDKIISKDGETCCFERDAKEEDIDPKCNVSYTEKGVIEMSREDVFTAKMNEVKSEKRSTRKVIGNEEEILSRDTRFENACFCNMCVSDSNVLAFKNEKSVPPKVLHFNQLTSLGALNDEIHLDCLDKDRLILLDTTEQKQGSPLDLPNTTASGVLLDDLVGRMTQVSSRPNTGGAGTGNTKKQGLATQTLNKRVKGGTKRSGNGDDDQSNNPRDPSRPLCKSNPSLTRLHRKVPTFFIGGHNGVKMVEATLSSLGWERIHDNNDPSFYLKWVECKRNLDFSSFREGEQLVNHIPNGNLLTTKIGLLTSLQEFDRVSGKVGSPNRRGIQMKDFVPETYKLQNQTEIENFIQHIYQDGEMWICKPTGMNQGKGIFLIRSRDELLEKLGPKNNNQGRQRCFPAPGRVIQRYILNPFLLNGYKADIRTYMLIAGTCPYMVFYHPGYVRLSLVPYSLNQEEVHAHLTNQYIQKKHPLYEQVKEETVWSLEQLQEYVNKTSNNALTPDWVFATFTKRMQEIMLHCFQSVRYKLDRKLGYFDLLGFDFMLDESFNVWLIEINVNPALHTNCKILSAVIPELVDTTLKLVLEVFEKSRRKQKIIPLENLGKFQLLFSDDKK